MVAKASPPINPLIITANAATLAARRTDLKTQGYSHLVPPHVRRDIALDAEAMRDIPCQECDATGGRVEALYHMRRRSLVELLVCTQCMAWAEV